MNDRIQKSGPRRKEPILRRNSNPAKAALLFVLLLAAVFACSPPEDDKDFSYDYHVHPLYDPARIIDIELTINPGDWDELRTQEHDVETEIGLSCTGKLAEPYTYFPARVTIDGEPTDNIGVRKKGFQGSLSTSRPSLKLNFGTYVTDQTILGLQRLTLNNNRQDGSFVRQCIGYMLFARAGLPASQCNFARVTVNGKYLGVYSNVEPIKKPLLKRVFGNKSGNLYEATSADFRSGEVWTARFEKKTNETEADFEDVESLISSLESDDESLIGQLQKNIDLDSFIRFWALEVIIGHWDGYAGNMNNYYFYHNPDDDLFHFIPWGIDGTFIWQNNIWPGLPGSIVARGYITDRLYRLAKYRERYVREVKNLLANIWNEEEMLNEIEMMENLLLPHIPDSQVVVFFEQLEYVRSFVEFRAADLRSAFSDGPPAWDYSPADVPCPGAGGRQFPPEVYAACEGKIAGEDCSFHGQNSLVYGICTAISGEMVCRPN